MFEYITAEKINQEINTVFGSKFNKNSFICKHKLSLSCPGIDFPVLNQDVKIKTNYVSKENEVNRRKDLLGFSNP